MPTDRNIIHTGERNKPMQNTPAGAVKQQPTGILRVFSPDESGK